MIVLYIICVDAYHISHKYKVRALIVLIILILYYQICILNQLYALSPNRTWEDQEIVIPVLRISVSLRALMLSSLSNFIIFIGKQLTLMLLHPNKAVLEVYPAVQWLET